MQLDSTERFYKYTDVEGARFMLRDGTLKFAQAAQFNDPFDNAIATLFAYDPIATLQEMREETVNLIFTEEELPSFCKSDIAQKTAWMRVNLKGTREQKEAARTEILAEPPESIWSIERLQSIDRETLATMKSFFAMDAIFCASLIHDNQLLWAHYAEKHKGMALEFVANVEKDSILRLMTKMAYSDERPVCYKSPKDFVYKAYFRENEEVLEEFTRALSLTKHTQWAYEQEVRAYIPLHIRGSEPYSLQNYHADELRAVYLGCKTDAQVEKEMVQLAVARNPNIKLFKMKMDAASYSMSAVSVDASSYL